MCGLYAIIDKTGKGFDQSDVNDLWHMGIITQHRGIDSSGMFSVGTDLKTPSKIVKRVGPFLDLYLEKNYNSFVKNLTSSSVVVGHGRYATVGKITKQNAHPFKEDHITMVHNGTIRGGLDHVQAEVDSHGLCIEIKNKGFKEAFANIDGAYAVIAHDQQSGRVYITRNIDRPLFYMEDYSRIYILSTRESLVFLKEAHNLGFSTSEIKPFAPNRLYVFEDGQLRDSEELVEKKSYVARDTRRWQPTRYQQPSSQQSKPSSRAEQAYKVGDEIEFKVTGYTIKGQNEVTYIARDSDKNVIFFKTNKVNKSWENASGIGTCNMVHTFVSEGNYLHQYQVGTREIVWEDEDENSLLTWDGEVITKKKWEAVYKNCVCETCNSAVAKDDNESTLVWEDQRGLHLVCGNCLEQGKMLGVIGENATGQTVRSILQ